MRGRALVLRMSGLSARWVTLDEVVERRARRRVVPVRGEPPAELPERLAGRLLPRADPHKGPFRPYLKQAIRNFLVDEHRRQARSVNPDVHPDALDGGWNSIVSDSSPRPDEALLRAWARSLVAMAVARLEAKCAENNQEQHFQLFVHRYLSNPDDPPSWREVGDTFGLGEKIARSRAETAVRHFRALLRDLIASDVGAEGDVDKELQEVIAVL